jgi:hypothetical protein
VENGRRETAEERGKGLVRRAVEEIWNQGNLGLADVLFSPTYVNHGGLIPDLVCGPEAIKASVAMYRAAFPRLHITVDALRAAGDFVDLTWTARRTPPEDQAHSAPEANGDRLQGTICGRIAANQIEESWTTWDDVGVLHRLGVLPYPDWHIQDAPSSRPAG